MEGSRVRLDCVLVGQGHPEPEVNSSEPVWSLLAPCIVRGIALTRQVMEGSRVRLDCVLVGHPEPEVSSSEPICSLLAPCCV